MKRLIILTVIMLLALAVVPASDTVSYEELRSGLKADFKGTLEKESLTLSLLPEGDKQLLYSQSKVKLALPLILNILPGFGVGSFVQRDYVSGAILLTADVVGFVGLGYGMARVIGEALALGISSGFTGVSGDISTTTKVIYFGSMGLLAVSRLYGIIAPIARANIYNGRLRAALYPSVDSDGAPVVAATASISF